MHVAICLWGLMRAARFTVHSFHTYVVKSVINYGHTYDIFVHTYSFAGEYGSMRNHEANVQLNFSDWKLFKPNYIYVEDQDAFDQRINYRMYQSQGDPWHNGFYSFKNHMRALNSLHHVTKAVESMATHRAYDGIIFVRPDVQFLNPLPIFLLSHYLSRAQPPQEQRLLFLPDFHRSCDGGEYNDRMAMGSLSAGLQYGKKLQTALAYSQGHLLHAERFTFHHLQHPIPSNSTHLRHADGMKIYEIPFRFRRVRSNGEIHFRDWEAVSPKEQARLEAKGTYFVGKGRRTDWWLRVCYTALEYLTLGRVYVWNHDDNGNVFCSPHPKVSYQQITELSKSSASTAAGHREDAHRQHEIHCNHTFHEETVGNETTAYIIPVNCR